MVVNSESLVFEYLPDISVLYAFFIKNVGKYEVIFPLRFKTYKAIIVTKTIPIRTPNVIPTALADFEALDVAFVVSKLSKDENIYIKNHFDLNNNNASYQLAF